MLVNVVQLIQTVQDAVDWLKGLPTFPGSLSTEGELNDQLYENLQEPGNGNFPSGTMRSLQNHP